MTAILYPVAVNAAQALSAPRGRAAREREAAALAGEDVFFISEAVGPVYATRDAALDAHAGVIEDERPGRAFTPAAEDRILRLAEQVAPQGGRRRVLAPMQPSFEDGRRWPVPKGEPPATVWRVMISYWRIGTPQPSQASGPQARQARKRSREPVDPEALRALTRQPLQPVKPQQPLDIGLFETRLPEAPHIIVPDE